MRKLRDRFEGFTVVELMIFIMVLIVIAVVAVANIRGLHADDRDNQAKSDINALYYQLEAFHEHNGYYPQKVNTGVLQGLDPDSLKDPFGLTINELGSRYSYKPKNCNKSKCKSFELSTQLEREGSYTKLSLSQ